MFRRHRLYRLFCMLTLAGLLLSAVVACNCGGPEPESKTPQTKTVTSGGGNEVTVPGSTSVQPPEARDKLKVEDIDPNDIGPGKTYPPLKGDKTVLAVVNLTPNGVTFNPPVKLKFRLPKPYEPGDQLEMQHFDEGKNDWELISLATVLSTRINAEGDVSHTSLFALAETEEAPTERAPVGSLIGRLGEVMRPIGEFGALIVYFPVDIGNEAVPAIERYLEEQGFEGEVLWAEIPPGAELSPDETVERMFAVIDQVGVVETAVLLIDQSDLNTEIVFGAAKIVLEEMGEGVYEIARMDTFAHEVWPEGTMP
jgi:hypothetical protein